MLSAVAYHSSCLCHTVGATVTHLNTDLEPSAAVEQHVAEVAPQAVVGPRLYGDADTLGAAPLRVLHRLLVAETRNTTGEVKMTGTNWWWWNDGKSQNKT